MNKYAFVFPGQASQKIGMMYDLAAEYPIVNSLFEIASKKLQYDLRDIVFNGPQEKLDNTIYTQPAMLVCDIAMWNIWKKQNKFMPELLAGHSLGEYAALVAAESIDFEDSVYLVSKRAELMTNESTKQGAMAAIIGLPDDKVIEICKVASLELGQIVDAANFNSPQQVVISGEKEAVDKVADIAKQNGAKKVAILPVSIASHCKLMKDAAIKLSKLLEEIEIKNPNVPVLHNVDANEKQNPDDIRNALIKQLSESVRWTDTILNMQRYGINTIIECGPGKVLTGLNKRICPDLKTFSLNDLTSLNALINDTI